MNNKAPALFEKTGNALLKIERVLLVILLAVVIFLAFYEVAARYFLKTSYPWLEGTTRYAFIWLCWIGSAYAFYNGSHIEINLFDSIVGKRENAEKISRGLTKVGILISLVFLICFTVIYFGYWNRMRVSGVFVEGLRIRTWIPLTGPLLGSVLMIIQGFLSLFKDPSEGSGTVVEITEPDETTEGGLS